MKNIFLSLTLVFFLSSCLNFESQSSKAGKLSKSISIETIGDVSSILIHKGSKLPTSYTEVFSTGEDNQKAVLIHLLRGNSTLVSENSSIGKFQITGIRPAPKGEPQIEVKIAIDMNEEIKVTAKDLDTGKEQTITILGH